MFLIIMMVGVLVVLILNKVLGSMSNPISLLFVGLYLLLFTSQFSITGVPAPSPYTVVCFLVAFTSAAIGVVVARPKRVSVEYSNNRRKENLLFYVFLFTCLMPILYVALDNLIFIFRNSFASYVMKARFLGDSVEIAGSGFMASYIERVVRPLSRLVTIIGAVLFFIEGRKKLLYVGALSLLLFSFIYVKRIDVMYLLVIFFSAFVLCKEGFGYNRRVSKSIHPLYVVMITIIVVYVTYYISSYRASSYSIAELIYHYGIGYHTFGIALFDHALNEPQSHIHDIVFPGVSIFGTITFLLYQFLKLFNVDYMATHSLLYSQELGAYVFMGYNTFNGTEIAPNAFYTSLYPIYRDLKFPGLVIVPFIFGVLLGSSYKAFKYYASIKAAVWVVFYTWVGYASILTPVLMGNTFWFLPVLIYFYFRSIRL